MEINRRHLILLVASLSGLPAQQAFADRKGRGRGREKNDDHDYEDATRARSSGDIIPLRDVLEKFRASFEGEIVGVEFEKEDGLWVYEIKIIATDGRYIEIYVNAKTNDVIKVSGK